MDEFTAETFANREEPVRLLSGAVDEERERPTSSRDRFSTYFKGKLQGIMKESTEGGGSLQDRLFTTLLQQVIPLDDETEAEAWAAATGVPSLSKGPPFSLPTMANNFRRFNARIGIVFQFQNKLRKLFAWRYPTQTWAFLFVYSFVCLDPYLLLVLPLVVLLFFIMIPAFLARHPAPPPTASTSSTTPYYSYEGPALAPAKTIKPVPETSKDFFRNMRDLQNSMADFASAHDVVASSVSPLANFSDEIMSSTVFLFLTAIGASLFITAHWLPWRLIFMMSGNVAVISGHPTVTAFLKHSQQLLAGKGSDAIGKPSESSGAITVLGYALPNSLSGLLDLLTSLAAVRLDSAPEEREVEIFELQHKVYSPYSATPEWEPFVFTPTPYDPLSPSRVAGDRPRGTRFFEDVSPPPGWAWKSKKWELDLDCAEWVMERMVTGVEFEVPGGGAGGGAVGGGASSGAAADGIGEEVGGWVWDLPFRPPDVGLVDEAGDVPLEGLLDGACNSKTKTEGLAGSQSTNADWEEATRRTDRVGEWRRRRWVRVVKRVRIDR